MESNITLWESRIAETEVLILLLKAAGASKKRLAILRGELEAFYGALRAAKVQSFKQDLNMKNFAVVSLSGK